LTPFDQQAAGLDRSSSWGLSRSMCRGGRTRFRGLAELPPANSCRVSTLRFSDRRTAHDPPRWQKVIADLWNHARSILVVASIAVGLFAWGDGDHMRFHWMI
jgi:hypothetical protein